MKLLSVKLKKEASSLFPDGYPHFIQSGQAKSPLTLVPHPGDLFYLCGNAVHDFFNYAFGISLKNIDTIWIEVHDKPGETRIPIEAELTPDRGLMVNRNVDLFYFLHGEDGPALDVEWIDFVYADYKHSPESFRRVRGDMVRREKYRKIYHVQFYYKG